MKKLLLLVSIFIYNISGAQENLNFEYQNFDN
jgi:hypothetical protein